MIILKNNLTLLNRIKIKSKSRYNLKSSLSKTIWKAQIIKVIHILIKLLKENIKDIVIKISENQYN